LDQELDGRNADVEVDQKLLEISEITRFVHLLFWPSSVRTLFGDTATLLGNRRKAL